METCADPDAGAFAADVGDVQAVDRDPTACLDFVGYGEAVAPLEVAVVGFEPAAAVELEEAVAVPVLVAAESEAVGDYGQAVLELLVVAGQEDEDAAGYEAGENSLKVALAGSADVAAVRTPGTAEPTVLEES